jgi:hypothetical protein
MKYAGVLDGSPGSRTSIAGHLSTSLNTKRPDQIGGGKPGPWRKPGIPNKANGLLKDAIIQAAEQAGGREGIVGYLALQARKHPAAFLALIGRVLPLQVQGRDTSEQIVVEIVHRTGDEPKLVEHVTGTARRYLGTKDGLPLPASRAPCRRVGLKDYV